jgi:hypothetical protein
MQSAYQVTGAIHRSVRDFVALVHGTPKWDRLRTVLAILVSNASVAADPALRRWHGHWKEALDTFDHYYRGSHPVLMVELTNEVASFHHERRMAMMQHLREQAAAGGSDS